ncbi:hypothetical protein ABO55_003478 [Salmonella enterica subsp. enterica]|nr:hypothetical protein [Salmonella enterica subsp. enterica serovar Abony]
MYGLAVRGIITAEAVTLLCPRCAAGVSGAERLPCAGAHDKGIQFSGLVKGCQTSGRKGGIVKGISISGFLL